MDRDQLYGDPEESWRIAFAGSQANIWTAMPGIVTAVNLSEMTCSVQPAIQGTLTDQNGVVTTHKLPLLIHVPIIFPQAGGFALTFPVAVNDEVLIVWANRCIDSWWQSSGIQLPIEARMHDISDGFCIPGPCSKPNVIPSISTTNAQLRTKSGNAYLELTPGGGVNIVAPAGFSINGAVSITGNVSVTGNVTSTAAISAAQVKEGLIELGLHHHTGVTVGSGTSGPPVP